MHSINMKRLELLEIVKKNKENHIKEFNEAIEDYKLLALKIAKENMSLAKTDDMSKIRKIKSLPNEPVSYEDGYTKAARMLELSVDDVIEVDEAIFNQLVLDEWYWKQAFTAHSALYKSM